MTDLNNKNKEKDLMEEKRICDPIQDESNGSLADRVKQSIKPHSIRAFALKIDVSEGTLRRILKGEDPKLSVVIQIARESAVELNWLITGQTSEASLEKQESTYSNVDITEFNEEFTLIAGYHINVSTGHGVLADEHPIKRHLAFRKKWLAYRKFESCKLAVVFAKGDSMEPTIHSNNSLLVDMAIKY